MRAFLFVAAAVAVLAIAQAGSGASNPVGWYCTGPAGAVIFTNWTGGTASTGGTAAPANAPTFSTGGNAYCVDEIDTYHWNDGKGDPGPAGVSLFAQNSALANSGGTWNVTTSSGQNNAPNVNWTATPSTASTPVIIQGSYTCYDPHGDTWSYDAAVNHDGFCKVVGRLATADGTLPSVAITAPAAGGKVGGGTFTFTVDANDTGSGIDHVTYQVEPAGGNVWTDVGNGTSAPWSFAWTPNQSTFPDGNYSVRAIAVDVAGNVTTSSAVAFSMDNTAPTITVQCNTGSGAGACSANWYTSAVDVTASATDGSGTSGQLRYTSDGTPPLLSNSAQAYTGAIHVAAPASLRFGIADTYGNIGDLAIPLRVDPTAPPAPVLQLGSNSVGAWVAGSTVWYRPTISGSAVLSVAASLDPESGLASVSWPTAIGLTGWTLVTSPLTANFAWSPPANTGPSFGLHATDNAGLTGPDLSVNFQPDSAPPTITVTCSPASCSNASGPVVVSGTESDTGSGLSGPLHYTIDGTDPSGSSATGSSVLLTRPTTVKFLAVDNVGNSQIVSQIVTQAAPAPGTFTVSSTADTADASPGDDVCADASGNCSLRAAVQESNALPAGSVITVPAGSYQLTTGALVVQKGMAINGAGARSTTVEGIASSDRRNSGDRVFDVTASASGVTISGFTLAAGTATPTNGYFGGDVRNAGNLTLRADTITNGSAYSGGGVGNAGGTLLIDRSTITANQAVFGGGDSGGVQDWGDGTNHGLLTIENSTITGNTASLGGGIYVWNDPANAVSVRDSTIAGNRVVAGDQGVRGVGGVGVADGGSMSFRNSIVAGNTVSGNPDNCGGSISSAGHNIELGTQCGFTAAGDLRNTDPKLRALANNGGPTDTLLPASGSPAIDGGDDANCPSADQRGTPRPQGGHCDIGAVELVPAASSGGTWRLGPDLLANATGSHANPFGAWEMLGASGLAHDPSTYHTIPASGFQPAACGGATAGLANWSDSTTGAITEINTTSAQIIPTACAPGQRDDPGEPLAHPGASNLVMYAWHSPISGTVSISGGFKDADCGGGNGVAWSVDRNATTILSGSFPNCGSASFPSTLATTVNTGDTLYFIVDPNGDYTYDQTQVDVTITQTSTGGSGAAGVIGVSPASDSVNLLNWLANEAVTVSDNGIPIGTVTTDASGNAFNQRSAFNNFDIKPGDTVSASDGFQSTSIVVADVTVDSVTYGATTMTGAGHAPAGTSFTYAVYPAGGGPAFEPPVTDTATANGTWSEATPRHAPPFTAQIVVRYGGTGNFTFATRFVQRPSITASLTNDWISLSNWTPNATLTVQINTNPSFTVTADANGNAFVGRNTHHVDLVPGTSIAVSDPNQSKTYALGSVTFDALDASSDTAVGTALPGGSAVTVCVENSNSGGASCQQTTSSATGSWNVPFAPFDVQPGAHGDAHLPNSVGDSTFAEITIAPTVSISDSSIAHFGDGTKFFFDSPTNGAQFRCAVDGGAPMACTSPFTAYAANGDHTFSVQAGLNNVFGAAATAQFTANVPAPGPGILRIDVNGTLGLSGTLDPAADASSTPLLNATCALLYNYGDQPAPQGTKLRPEVATAMPTISSDGLTYTITVGSGYAFADGTPVTAQSYADALNRDIDPALASTRRNVFTTFSDVASASASGNLLTIVLKKADYDLVDRLANPYVCPVPVGTPHGPVLSVLGSGPYTAAVSADRDTLTPNPYYKGPRPRNWSEIDVDLSVDPQAADARVTAGSSDFVLGGPRPQDVGSLPPSQILVSQGFGVQVLTLNTSRPPFNDVNLRKAVEFAVNRPALAQASAGLQFGGAPATDQILSPGQQGYTDWNIYPLGGPDLTTALHDASLAHVDPTHRISVQLYTTTGAARAAIAAEVQTDLAQIGIDVVVNQVAASQLFGSILPSGTDDMGSFAWLDSGTDPQGALEPLLHSGPTFAGSNVSKLVDPTIDSRLDAADASPPPTRYDQYGTIERDALTNDAPLVAYAGLQQRDFFSGRIAAGSRIYNPALPGIDIVALSTAKVVTNTNDSGPGSLRQAILDAQNGDTIAFNIPGSGVQTITPASPLPPITNTVTIDGYTQPGSSANTLHSGDNAKLLIELQGSSATANAPGLDIRAPNTVVRGLVVDGGFLYGIEAESTGATIAGNFLGIDPGGTAPLTPAIYGVGVFGSGASGNTIGGPNDADRNLVSGVVGSQGTNGAGVAVGTGAQNTVIRNNEIGTNAAGTLAVANQTGIFFTSTTTGNTIQDNLIAGNNGAGIAMQQAGGTSPVTNTAITGNAIGIASDGTTALGNGGDGIQINTGVDFTQISHNQIANNGGRGISISSVFGQVSGNNQILTNSIHDNGGKGIQLIDLPSSAGVGQANRGVKPPVITAAATSGVTGTLAATQSSANTIELFASDTCDASGSGEGQTFLGSITVQTDANGAATWSFAPEGGIPAGQVITATETWNATGDTSEFSVCSTTASDVTNLVVTSDQSSTSVGVSSLGIDSLPGALFPILAGSPAAAPLGDAAIARSAVGAPLGDAPLGDAPLGDAPLGDAPLGDAPLGDAPLGDAPLGDAPLGDAPLGDAPLGDAGLAGLPLGDAATSSPLDYVLLSSLPGVDASALFAGTPLDGRLPQQYTLGDVYRNATARARFEALHVTQAGLGRTALGAVEALSYALGDKPIGQIQLPNGQSWCDALLAHGGSCANIDLAHTTLIGLDITRQLGTLYLGKLTVAQIGGLGGTLLADAKLADIAVQRTSLATLQTSALTPGTVTCTSSVCPTLGDAAAQKAISPTATLGMLSSFVSGSTLDELVGALRPRNAYPWETQSFVGWQAFNPNAPRIHYYVDFDVKCSTANVDVSVKLPFGFTYAPGSSTLQLGVGNAVSVADPALDPKLGAVWKALGTVCVGMTQHARLSFVAKPGLGVGPTKVTASVTAATAGAKTSGAPVLVQRGWPASLDRSTEPEIFANTLVFSQIETAGGTNFFKFKEQRRGELVTIYMSPPAGTDYDLYVIRPAPTSLISSPLGDAPLGDAPLGDAPLGDAPLGDAPLGDAGTSTSDNPPPELLQDGPLPSGQVAVNSIRRGDGTEVVQFRQAGSTGYDEIAVAGYNGAFSSQPFELRVKADDPAPLPSQCPARPIAPTQQGTLPVAPLPTTTQALALVNRGRMIAMYGQPKTDAMLTKLNAVMARVNGQVLQIDGDTGVYNASRAWDASPCSIDAANAYVAAINALVARYRTGLQLHSITIVGDDEQIPFARVPDFVSSTSEFDNSGTLSFLTSGNTVDDATYAAAAGGYVLTDDAYAALHTHTLFGHEFFLPEIATGRLVETPDEISGQLQQYLDTTDGVLHPASSLSTGYDFMSDAAQSIDAGIAPRITVAGGTHTLLQDTWGKSALQGFLDGTQTAPDINSWNAHYDYRRMRPAVAPTSADLLTTQAFPLTVTPQFKGRIFFTMGCHAGESIDDSLFSDPLTTLDWAQAYSRYGAAVFVGNTGYGYGDTESVALSERLLTLFAGHLAFDGSVGEKFMQSKNEYFASMGVYGPYDEKALEEATFYGLPFWKVNSPTETPPPPPAITGTDAKTGLPVAALTIRPSLHQVADPRGTFWNGDNGVVFVQSRSVQPLTSRDVTQDPTQHLVAHGFFPSGVVTEDHSGLNLYFAKPMVDQSGHEPEPPITNDTFPASPVKMMQADYLGARHSTLDVIAGQSRPGSAPNLQTERLYTSLSGVVTYAPDTATDFTPPRFQQTGSVVQNGTVTLFAVVSDESSGGVKRVRAFFTGGGPWQFVDLSPVAGAPNTWSGTTPTTAAKVEAGFVAEDASGNTGWMTGKGVLVESYTPGTASPPPPPSITIDKPLDGGTYTVNQSVSAGYTCTGLGGIKSCTGPVAPGGAVDTGLPVGPKTFTVTATPVIGSSASKSATYNVVYNFGGFQPPITTTANNLVKAGSSVPVKFSLHGNFGLGILKTGYPESGTVACTGGSIDIGDSTVTAGNSSLQYDTTSDTYTYVWQTQKAWVGTCRQLLVVLNDGVIHRATFQFK